MLPGTIKTSDLSGSDCFFRQHTCPRRAEKPEEPAKGRHTVPPGRSHYQSHVPGQCSAEDSNSSVTWWIPAVSSSALSCLLTVSIRGSSANTTCAVRAFSVVLIAQTWIWCTALTPGTASIVFSTSSMRIPTGTPSSDRRRLSATRPMPRSRRQRQARRRGLRSSIPSTRSRHQTPAPPPTPAHRRPYANKPLSRSGLCPYPS